MKASKSIFRIQSSPLNHNPTSQLNHKNTHALEEKTGTSLTQRMVQPQKITYRKKKKTKITKIILTAQKAIQ